MFRRSLLTTATVVVDGAATPVLAHEAEGGERDRLWRAALRLYPGYAAYQRRAAPRRIPVRTPTGGPDEVSTRYRESHE